MSELRQLVEALRGLSDDGLRSLVAARLIPLSNIDDFYSLAEILNSPKSYASVIGSLSRRQLSTLSAIAEGEAVKIDEFESLLKLQLVYRDQGKAKAYDALLEQLKANKAFTRSLRVVGEQPTAPNQTDIDKNCGLVAFETMQALTELIFDLEKHLIREVGKGGVGLPDVKRLASALGKPNDFAKTTFALSGRLGLMTLSQGRHLLTAEAIEWLEQDQLARMKTLYSNFTDLLGPELSMELASLKAGASLKLWLEEQFPLAENTVGSRIGQILFSAESFGLTFEEHTASWFNAAVAGSKSFEKLISPNLPAVQERIILQADLSIIAPGPLPTKIEALLRRFANTEHIGLASTYRLSALSVCHGLETGLTTEEIAEILSEAFGSKLPQPVEYLLAEVKSRFGRLVVTDSKIGESRSTIESSDNVLLTEIGNDPRLRPFSLIRPSNEKLSCRFEPSVVYFGLRECGYLAIRKDENGKVVSPIESAETATNQSALNKWDERIAKLRVADLSSAKAGNDEVMTRQVQMAIRNKAKLSITVNRPDGTQLIIELEPSGIANGRLRGLDRKAQVERTLPLTTISAISLA
jgi:hypothetical protein